MQGNVYFPAASSLLFLLCLAHKALAAAAQGLLSFLLEKQGKKAGITDSTASLGCSLAGIQGISRAAIQGQLSGSGKSLPDQGFLSYHLSLELLVVFI